MSRIACIVLIALLTLPYVSNAETIDVHIKGLDDGVKTSKQHDYMEAVLFAKREAIERAGVKVKSFTTMKDFVVQSDYIESKAEAVLMPGYQIVDVGYQKDGTYLVILIGKVKTSTFDSSPKEVGRDGHFIKYANGVVWDTNTALEWYAGPNIDSNWYEAKRWVKSLNIAGGGWRMPTRKELKTLYNKRAEEHNMTPLLKTTGWWVWSGETKSSETAWTFAFFDGFEDWGYRDDANGFRGFAVRSRR